MKIPKTINSNLKSVKRICLRLELNTQRPAKIINQLTLKIIAFIF